MGAHCFCASVQVSPTLRLGQDVGQWASCERQPHATGQKYDACEERRSVAITRSTFGGPEASR